MKTYESWAKQCSDREIAVHDIEKVINLEMREFIKDLQSEEWWEEHRKYAK